MSLHRPKNFTPAFVLLRHRRPPMFCPPQKILDPPLVRNSYQLFKKKMLTANLDHLFFDLAQTEDVLCGENGTIVDERVVNASDVARTQHEAH